MQKTKNEMLSIQDKMIDVINHPESDLEYISKIRNEFNFSDIEMVNLKSAFNKLLSNQKLSDTKKINLIQESWKISFKERPPTIDEFLTEKWIGGTSESLFPYMKEEMNNFFKTGASYRDLILHTHIGWGKSTFAMLIMIYISVYYALLRNPKHFLGQAPTALIMMAVLAVTQSKAEEITTRPILNILGTTEKFRKCRTEEQLDRLQKEDPSKIYYTTATTKGSIFRIADLNFKQVSQVPDLLGINILGATCTELTFFNEQPGWNDEKIMKFYTKLKGRIYKRFQNHWMARSILDSSPNTMESDLTKFIVEKAPLSDKNYIIDGSAWQWQPWMFEKWNDDHSLTFPVYLGSESVNAKIITEAEREKYDIHDIIEMPEDIKDLAEENLSEIIKDYAGRPTKSSDKLVNLSYIEPIFSPALKNIYTYIHVPANLPPEGLIWDKIKDQFFYKVLNNKYEFYRNPKAKRYLSVDQSEKNDWTGIAMSHVEMNKQGELIYVTDFSITIVPTKEKINLEAIKFFIRDLRKWGGINISKVSFDQFQSSSTIQYLERHGFDVVKQSVDISTEPYLNYIGLMSRNCVKMGKNIVMKNNLKSLIMSRTKIAKKPKVDHTIGDVPSDLSKQDWETSKIGYNAKDLSDAVVASVYLADTYGSKTPSYIWEDIKNEEENIQNKEIELHKKILKNYKLKRVI